MFCLQCSFILFFGGHLWKCKPPGATGDETLVFGNPNVAKKSGFEKCLVYLFYCFSEPCSEKWARGTNFLRRFWWEWSRNLLSGEIKRHVTLFGPPIGILRKWEEINVFRFCKTRSRETWGESILELFPATPTYQNPINMNFRPVLCNVLCNFQFLPSWTL